MKRGETKRHIHRFIWLPVIVITIGIIVGFWKTYARSSYPDTPVNFGVTVSTLYSTELGLDWKDVYIQSLDDLGIRLFRIPVYWNEIEQEQGKIDLTNIQWILDEAQKRDAKVMLAIGQRVPRWPECHPPEWTKNMRQSEVQKLELNMIGTVVNTFKEHPSVLRWQVENEPLFSIFGECPKPDDIFLVQAVELVKELDPSRKVVVTDSGELSSWIRVSHIADILGISMYRVTWNSFWGYFYYPLPPAHYTKKAELVGSLVEDVIVTELQVEPWVPTTMLTSSLEEQFKSMNVDNFWSNIDYARRTGFSEIFLWGVEWWYWLKEIHYNPTMWDAGRELFSGQFKT